MTLPPFRKNNGRVSLSDIKRPIAQPFSSASRDEYAVFRTENKVLGNELSLNILPAEKSAEVFQNEAPLSVAQTRPARMRFFYGFRKVVGITVFILVLGIFFVMYQGFQAKEQVIALSESGFSNLAEAAQFLKAKQYDKAEIAFRDASVFFEKGNNILTRFGGPLLDITRFIPPLAQLSSGRHAILAGKYFSQAGVPLASLLEHAIASKEAYDQGEKISLLEVFVQAREPIQIAHISLSRAEEELDSVRLSDIPEDKREKFIMVRTFLPTVLNLLSGFEKNEILITELLGGNGPRIYLFLLQNNHEMRATGGFIGTYALIDINQGVIRRFFVDGIFNPDGQLRENIIPPKPIQKISAGWSLHDSNWFPDFPTSAEKAMFFYEKTGGATVDGVITLTPTVMQKLLAVTGSIVLPQYGLSIDADNFIPVLQEQVEEKYDKELNQPKKILSDLSEKLFERVFAVQDRKTSGQLIQALVDGLNEKHILLYMRHPETEKLIDEVGWSGRVLETSKDYLSVIHSNINGYKTDGVIDESIKHRVKIEDDGSIIDTVTIVRTHHGGDTPYDWWNKVNADYIRVYVPKGSELISSEGTTWEFPKEPLDYKRLGFKEDADVLREEEGMVVDQKTGVRISEDAGKTVFGAWAYVSPKESVTLVFRYRLPFRIDMKALTQGEPQTYATLFQKQSGSLGSTLVTTLSYPENLEIIWQTEPNLVPYGREWRRETNLKTDVFEGVVFGQK